MDHKYIACNIHGSIKVSSIALKIVDSPEFQRMRRIKQLGLCYLVYPSATHTRFEHSIGTYHLAGIMLEKMKHMYPDRKYYLEVFGKEKKLSDKLIECVKIAALCHDIGHGPFSHIFDDVLLAGVGHDNKLHETRSCLITEMICRRELSHYLSDKHIEFIKTVINPTDQKGSLYQIVSNNLNGIDVDKFDYLLRDSSILGQSIGFVPSRLINEFIIDANDNIVYPVNCSLNVFEMFHARYIMHKKVYSHKTVKLLEAMLEDIFTKIDPIFSISCSIYEMGLFCKLTDDSVFNYLEPNYLDDLDEKSRKTVRDARDIYQAIVTRKLYKQICNIKWSEQNEKRINRFVDYIVKKHNLNSSDFTTVKTTIGFVSGQKEDPFSSIYFYDKKQPDKTFTVDKTEISGMVNNTIQEFHIHLICKKRDVYELVIQEFNAFESDIKTF